MKPNHFILKFYLTLLLGIGIVFPVSASDSLKTHIRAVASVYDPFVSEKDSVISGFDVDLLKLICTINNWTYEIKLVPFYKLIDLVEKDSADIAIGAVYITDERKNIVTFSNGYFNTGLTIVSSITKPLHTSSDLKKLRVGVKAESTGFRFAKKLNADDGLDLTIVPYYTTDEIFEALKNNEVDAVLNDFSNSYFITLKRYPGLFHISDQPVERNQIAFPVSDSFKKNLPKINTDP